MNGQDFTATIIVDKPVREAFDAINDPRAWWGKEIDGDTARLGEEWTYRYKDMHRSTQKVTELVPCQKVVWRVVDSDLSFLTDRTEWNGTEIVFELNPSGDGTEIRFTHRGVNPQVECYDMCSNAWGGLIRTSLRNVIQTGKGDPDNVE